MKLDQIADDEIEEWERGLTPIQRFEKLVQYGQVARLFRNSFFLLADFAKGIDVIAQLSDKAKGDRYF